MSERSVIRLKAISSSRGDTESVVLAPVSPSLFDGPEEKLAGERGEESPVGGPEGRVEVDVCETEAGTEAEVEDKDGNVVGGIAEVAVSGYESEGFTLSEILRRRRLAKKICRWTLLTPPTCHNVSF